ncbi:MAG: YlmH/Sll1252 family protein [Clostridia bacterium]|nr:YlmH/Sll1252 family protein [Clostridia bacterium]
MFNKEKILKKVLKQDDRLLVAKILDKWEKAQKTGKTVYTDFLDPYQRNIVEKALEDFEDNYIFEGGYLGAERQVLVFCPNNMPEDNEPLGYLPFKAICVKLKGRGVLSHRDYLGSLMGLGIKREKIGDILVKEDSCSILVLEDMGDFIRYNLTKVGNINVDVEVKNIEELESLQPKVKVISTTVASLRLDSVASAGFGMSRSKISEFIKAEKVNLNWEMTSSLTKQVSEGDTISIRGKGRAVLEIVNGITKKGRISIVLNKYI